ncbi:MAG: DUF481 domain-containing protein [Desulfobacterales bacterium]|jgi:putative salt-induced outer membrane protein YdiY
MNRSVVFVIGFLTFYLLLQVGTALAGEVRLKNGDRLTGNILKLEEGKLTLQTDYAGGIQLDWSEVSCLSTDRVHAFLLPDRTRYRGIAECPEAGVLQIRQEGADQTRRVPISALQSVNPAPSVRYKGSLTAGGSVASGNTESRSLYGNGSLGVRSEKHRLTLSGRSNYAENDDTLTARNANAFGKYDYFFTRKLFGYGQTLLEEDRLQDLNLRATFGAGLGFQFFDTDRLALYAEAGPSYVNENYENTENRGYASGRWSVRFDWQILPERVKFFHLHELYVSLEDTEDFYIRSEQGFRLPLIDKFFFNLQMDYDYKNKPAADKKNADLRYLLGLGYEFSN